MTESSHIIWFDKGRIPAGTWPFLNTVWRSLRSLRDDVLLSNVDLTEGLGSLTITGCFEAYRQVILRRTLDLAQSTVITWNAGLAIGAVISARGLLETLAAFHSLLEEAKVTAEAKNWDGLSQLIDAYTFSTSDGPDRTTGRLGGPPVVGKQVIRFIQAIEPQAVRFWHQISDISHPNGKPMLHHFAVLKDHQFEVRALEEGEREVFQAIYNCLYSICWFYNVMDDYNTLLNRIRHIKL